MELEIPPERLPDLEDEIGRLAPWLHPYKLSESVYTGWHKARALEPTFCVSTSPAEVVRAHAAAFADYTAGQRYWHVDEALRLAGLAEDALDIACATGRFSFRLALAGVPRVRGVEIRPQQIAQCELLRDADRRFAERDLRFEHEPESADAPGFRAGEEYDLVLSMGLLYHLTNPVQHLVNLARLTRKAALVSTFAHRQMRGAWELVLEDAGLMTKAAEGVSWIPHFADVPDLLRRAGFSRVTLLVHPLVARYQDRLARELEADRAPRRLRELDHALRQRFENRRLPELRRVGQHPRYFAYLAWK